MVERGRAPDISEIRDIALKFVPHKIKGVRLINSGLDSFAFEIFTESENFVIRTSGRNQNYDVEHELLRIAKERGVRVSRPVAVNVDLDAFPFAFSVLEKMPGGPLLKVDKGLWPRILEEVGQQLMLLHSIKLDGFGEVDKQRFRSLGVLVGGQSSWIKHVFGIFKLKVRALEAKFEVEKKENFEKSVLTKMQIGQLIEILSRIPWLMDKVENEKWEEEAPGSLIHGDIHFEHILVDGDMLSGLIDFNKTLVGDPLFDIAYFSVMPGGEYYPHILKSTGLTWNDKKFHLYRLLMSIRKIHTRYVAYNYLHLQPKVLNIAIEELSYFE